MDPIQGLSLNIPDSAVRELLENLLAASPVAVMITDSEGNVIGVNKAHHELTGLTFDKIVNQLKMNFRRYMRVVNPGVAEELEKAYKGESIELGDFFYRVAGGPGIPVLSDKLKKGFWLDSRVFPIKDDEGRVKYVVIFNTDITTKKEIDILLIEAQKMESIGTLAGGLAHDFNNILSGVVGYASLLATRLEEGTTDFNAAKTILNAADRASTLTNHLLTIARKSVPSLVPMSLGDMLPATAEFLIRTLGPTYPITVELDEELWSVDADRPQIEQVVTNLCLNAKDAMPQGGPIKIRSLNKSFKEVTDCPRPNMPPGDYVALSVIDEGVGMPPDVVNRVFEPFFTTKEMGRGTGLGLAIVYGIIKSHRGFIVVKSMPNMGTKFSIYFPKTRGQKVHVPRLEASGDDTGESARHLDVLVVDDDPMVRRVLSDMLYRLGHRPAEAESVKEAQALLIKDWSRFDVLVVDLVMPDEDGFELVKTVQEADSNIPVLICTGYSAPEVHVRARDIQGVEVLAKPFDMRTFGKAITDAARK